jgi:hypothetical protein
MPADQIRNRTVGCKMTDGEYERLSAVVEGEGMTLGEWCPQVLLERADDSGGASGWDRRGWRRDNLPCFRVLVGIRTLIAYEP